MPTEPPRPRAAAQPWDSLDPHEWEGTGPRAPGERRQSAVGAAIVVLLLVVGIASLVVLI